MLILIKGKKLLIIFYLTKEVEDFQTHWKIVLDSACVFFFCFFVFLRSPLFTEKTCGHNVMLSDIPHTSIPSYRHDCWPWNILSIHTTTLYFLQCPVFPFCYFDVEMFLALNTRETALLVDPENSSSASKQWVALVVGELCSFHFSSFCCSIRRIKSSSFSMNYSQWYLRLKACLKCMKDLIHTITLGNPICRRQSGGREVELL